MIPLPSNLALKLVAGLCAVLLVGFLVHDRSRWKAQAERYATAITAERSAHSATVANFRAAAELARRQDAENRARVQAEQAAINERTANDFENRIAAARARADQLQRQARAASADPGRGRATPMPGLSASAEGAAQAAGENRLPHAEHRPQAEVAPLGADDALIATEQAIQLDELIKWVRAQSGVKPSDD